MMEEKKKELIGKLEKALSELDEGIVCLYEESGWSTKVNELRIFQNLILRTMI